MKTAKQIIKEAYGLSREITDTELRDEIANLQRRESCGTLDNHGEMMVSRLSVAGHWHPYQPRTGVKCSCRLGMERDNCPQCEGTGWVIDFAAIRKGGVK